MSRREKNSRTPNHRWLQHPDRALFAIQFQEGARPYRFGDTRYIDHQRNSVFSRYDGRMGEQSPPLDHETRHGFHDNRGTWIKTRQHENGVGVQNLGERMRSGIDRGMTARDACGRAEPPIDVLDIGVKG